VLRVINTILKACIMILRYVTETERLLLQQIKQLHYLLRHWFIF